jgi:indolepyruvate ferredoxin oxidoreductase beta subunit
MKKSGNILLCGVGGQGILLASEVLSSVLLKGGYDVKQSEVHGMAQRGGSVVSHIRYGEKVYSPLIEPGTADTTVSFELLEALRYLPFYRKAGTVIVNTQKILPSPVASGMAEYPDDVIEQLTSRGLSVHPVDAFEIASAAGEKRAANIVLLGALSAFLPLSPDLFLDTIEGRVPERFRKANLEAFRKGREAVSQKKAMKRKA